MFGLFGKHKKTIPPFNALADSPLRSKYFGRTATWGWATEAMIYVVDPHNARIITMDRWPQEVFLHADGKSTVESFVHSIAERYGRGETIPLDLDVMIMELIEEHVNGYKILTLSDDPIDLPDPFLNSGPA